MKRRDELGVLRPHGRQNNYVRRAPPSTRASGSHTTDQEQQGRGLKQSVAKCDLKGQARWVAMAPQNRTSIDPTTNYECPVRADVVRYLARECHCRETLPDHRQQR